MDAIEELADSFSRLPGIGKKSALRITYALLTKDKSFMEHFSKQLATLQDRVHTCKICGGWTQTDTCSICDSSSRERSTLCIVQAPPDIESIEALHVYNGLYHVLGGVIAPLQGVMPDKLNIPSLIRRLKASPDIREVIIAINPTTEGNTTALYLQHILKDLKVKVTRIALGLPMGGDIGYADSATMLQSFRGRVEL